MTELTLTLVEEKLTDGSRVYNVHLGPHVVFHAVSETDAADLLNGMVALLDKHTVDTVRTGGFHVAA